jgi:hypothetical protein
MVHPLLPLIPADAERVKIKNKDGTESFVFVQDLKDSDDVVLSSSNLPVITKKAYGRPKGSKKQKGLQLKNNLHSDPLVQSLRKDPESPNVLTHVMAELGEETYVLKSQRDKIFNLGGDTSNLSGRRIQALKSIADIYIKRKDQVASSNFEVESPQALAFAEALLDTVFQCMAELGVERNLSESVMSLFTSKAKDPTWKTALYQKVKDAADIK